MRLYILTLALFSALPLSCWAETYNQNVTAIFGLGNPDTGWTTDTGSGITLALRAKDRDTSATTNISGLYQFAIGTSSSNVNRARWNWEFSINSGSLNLNAYDYYVAIDVDPSQCKDFRIVDALSFWNDNSYGINTTANGAGNEGPAALFAGTSTVAQQSQNLRFSPSLGDPNLDATYDYELFAVEKGNGLDGQRLVSVAITVNVGSGGEVEVCDSDNDGVEDEFDHCVPSVLGGSVDVGSGPTSIANNGVDADGCSIQDLVNECIASARNHGQYVSCIAHLANNLRKSGVITNKQSTELKNGAAKSQIGK